MSLDNGCILLSRALLDSVVFQNEKWLKVWVWCLLRANFKEKSVPVKTGAGFSVVDVQRGQFIFGRNKNAKDLNMPPSTLWKVILKLEKLGNLNTQRNSHYTIITICNYDLYQDLNSYKGTPKVTGKEQPSDNQGTQIINESKKVRNKVKNTFSNEFEECWKIVPRREGTKQGKKPAGILFEKLSLEDKRKCYFGLENYSMFCKKSGQPAMDFEKFIRNCIFDDYQKKIIVPNKTPKTTSDHNAEFFENRKKQQTGNQCVIAK